MKIAKCKLDGKEFKDIINASGALISHLKENYPEIEIPSKWKRAKQFKETGHYWHERYYDIINTPDNIKNIVDENELCELYTNGSSINSLCIKYKIGKLKVKDILYKHNIEIKKKGAQHIKKYNYEYVKDKYKDDDENTYIAVSKTNSEDTFKDYQNNSGVLTQYVEKTLNIKVPSSFLRMQYFRETGKYWYEQYFDIVQIKKENRLTKKCKYCEWETVDIKNRSGAYKNHLINTHGIEIKDYLEQFPEEKEYFITELKQYEREIASKNNNLFIECPLCGNKYMSLVAHLKLVHDLTTEQFKLNYPYYPIISKSLHEINVKNYKLSNLVVSKNRFISKSEKEISEFLKNNGLNVECNRQMLIGQEIDMYIPDKNVGIEFDGLKWHTEFFGKKKHSYHLDKTIRCQQKGVKLIHIFEDEYINKKDIVLAKLKQILQINNNIPIVYGRKCRVKEIYKNDAKNFLEKNHIQGYVASSIYIGAFYNNQIIGVACFKNGNIKHSSWELTRFATDINIRCVGICGKMLNYFIKEYEPNKIISYADRRWTWENNNIYTKLGFKLIHIGKPDYRYYNEKIDKYKRVHKMTMNKQVLHKRYGFPLTMTELEMAKELGYDRIWDCGLLKYELIVNQ